MRKDLKKLVKELDLIDRVEFIGYEIDVLPYYKVFDILVMLSKFESFGLTVLEGQAMGVPVIASNVFGLSGILGR